MGINAPLLVKSAESQELCVNFDTEILTQIREAECMSRIGLEIPPFATILKLQEDVLKKNYNRLLVCLGGWGWGDVFG